MKRLTKEIVKQIEKKVNTERAKEKVQDVIISVARGSIGDEIEITPKNGHTFFCMDELVLIAHFYGISYYVTLESTIIFRLFGINK